MPSVSTSMRTKVEHWVALSSLVRRLGITRGDGLCNYLHYAPTTFSSYHAKRAMLAHEFDNALGRRRGREKNPEIPFATISET